MNLVLGTVHLLILQAILFIHIKETSHHLKCHSKSDFASKLPTTNVNLPIQNAPHFWSDYGYANVCPQKKISKNIWTIIFNTIWSSAWALCHLYSQPKTFLPPICWYLCEWFPSIATQYLLHQSGLLRVAWYLIVKKNQYSCIVLFTSFTFPYE